jgi:hypothetical protein
MDDSERTVEQYLTSLGIGTVQYEPDGNIPPDFLVDGRIAVEVRRLNQNEERSDGHRGLEVTAKPLHAIVEKILAESGPPPGPHSWFVFYRVWRPLPSWRSVEAMLRRAVEQFREQLDSPPAEIRLDRSLRVSFLRASEPHETLLVLGGWTDRDSGGFVVAELLRNLRLCIAEKSRKVAAVRHRYREWWLAFEDRVGYGALDADDMSELRDNLRVDHEFDKVLLVSPLAPRRAIEI